MQGRVLVLAILVSLVFASCHHNCNDHGTCMGSTCICFDGYTGDDCSLEYHGLTPGGVVSGTMGTPGNWVYYHYNVTVPLISMTYSVYDHLGGDCDMYVRYSDFPTKSHYDYKDDSWDNEFSIQIFSPQQGNWIAGLYDFIGCEYDLTFLIEAQPLCENNCSGHGVCTALSECVCDDGYGGSDCSQVYVSLDDRQVHAASVDRWAWNIFYFDSVVSENTESIPSFSIVVNQTQPNQDSDLYVKFAQLPTLWDYDFRDAAILSNYALPVGSPQEGRYYIGVYGYTATTYNIHVQVNDDVPCSDLCSSHGYCSNNQCHCNAGFSGTSCETMDSDLVVGQSVEGYAAGNMWNYYGITANSAQNMVVTIDQSFSTNGDCDVYIRANQIPDKFHYDYRDIGFDTTFSIVVQNPLSTPWHIGVYGYRACQYFITVTLEASCPSACSGHGTCSNGRCTCSSGYAGVDCASTLTRVHSGTPLNDTITQNAWKYYKYTAPSGVHTSVTVELYEYSTVGYIQLYLLAGAAPSLVDYSYSDTNVNRALHNIYFEVQDATSDYYIGVYGSSYVPVGSPAAYELLVYSPPI